MAIIYVDSTADPSEHSMALAIDISGLDITVHGGAITISGEDKSLVGDWPYTMPTNATYDQSLNGFLIQDLSDDSIKLMIDTIVGDGVDKRYNTFEGDGYKLLARIFHAIVPANTTDLADVDFRIWRMVPPPVEE